MEALSEQDVYFLVALSAAEESSLIELKWEFEKWDVAPEVVLHVIESLIKRGVILLSERSDVGFSDYSESESIEISKVWKDSKSWETILFLTEQGEKCWEVDDWGITTARAKHLMFSTKGKLLVSNSRCKIS